MNREDDRDRSRDFFQRLEYAPQRYRIVHVRRTMQGESRVSAMFESPALGQRQSASELPVLEERINHHVADEKNLLGRNPFGPQVFVGEMVRGEQVIAEHIGAQPV